MSCDLSHSQVTREQRCSQSAPYNWIIARFGKNTKIKTRLPSNLRRDHPRYVCSLLVTWQTWRLHHSIRRTQKAYVVRKQHCFMFDGTELLPIEVLHYGIRNFRPIWLLRPWPWPDDLHIRTWLVVLGNLPRAQIWTSYVKAFESYRLTDRHRQTDGHTDTTKETKTGWCFSERPCLLLSGCNQTCFGIRLSSLALQPYQRTDENHWRRPAPCVSGYSRKCFVWWSLSHTQRLYAVRQTCWTV